MAPMSSNLWSCYLTDLHLSHQGCRKYLHSCSTYHGVYGVLWSVNLCRGLSLLYGQITQRNYIFRLLKFFVKFLSILTMLCTCSITSSMAYCEMTLLNYMYKLQMFYLTLSPFLSNTVCLPKSSCRPSWHQWYDMMSV